jgi:hypothetical protein
MITFGFAHLKECQSFHHKTVPFVVMPIYFNNFGQFCAFVPQFFHLLSGAIRA